MIRLTALTLLLSACGSDAQPDPYPLTKEFYAWQCKDYEDYTEVIVTTETCDEDVQFIVAELHLTTAQILKTNLKTQHAGDCHWEESFLLVEEYCVEVEGVALTAYAY